MSFLKTSKTKILKLHRAFTYQVGLYVNSITLSFYEGPFPKFFPKLHRTFTDLPRGDARLLILSGYARPVKQLSLVIKASVIFSYILKSWQEMHRSPKSLIQYAKCI